jgi:hypothetical protein
LNQEALRRLAQHDRRSAPAALEHRGEIVDGKIGRFEAVIVAGDAVLFKEGDDCLRIAHGGIGGFGMAERKPDEDRDRGRQARHRGLHLRRTTR